MKYQEKDTILESSSEESQSEDDEDGWMLTEEVEKEFHNTLSKIKNKDPEIYEKNKEFFKNIQKPENVKEKSTRIKPLTIQNYEHTMVVKKGALWSDEDSEEDIIQENLEPTYVQEQEELKKSFKKFVNSSSEDDEGGNEDVVVGLLKKREKPTEEKISEEEKNVMEWLENERNKTDSKSVIETVQNLEVEEEEFLRDYILNKRFLDKYDEDIEPVTAAVEKDADEKVLSFEGHDEELIKRYPRTMENSLRRKDESRKKKREEVKERKLKEKEKKIAEIRLKKKQKRKEIEEELENLKKLTGNDQIESVLDRDFDFDEYDKAMQKLFNDEFYSQDDPDFKPVNALGDEDNWKNEEEHGGVEDIEEYNNMEQLDEYADNGEGKEYEGVAGDDEYLNCEDPDFNMDCDYDPTLDKPKQTTSRSRRRKDKHRRTTVSEAISKEKPLFDPTKHKSFQEYMDKYYAIDCEDFIGDLACRFKYRRTVPNSYGLTIEEILTADEKELERWCSIKRIKRINPISKERCDVKVFKHKAADERLKRKILPSLYKKQEEYEKVKEINQENHHQSGSSSIENVTKEFENTNETFTSEATILNDKILKTKKKKKKHNVKETSKVEETSVNKQYPGMKRKLETTDMVQMKKIKKANQNNDFHKSTSKFGKKKAQKNDINSYKKKEHSTLTEMSDARLLAYGIKPKKFRNKLKYT